MLSEVIQSSKTKQLKDYIYKVYKVDKIQNQSILVAIRKEERRKWGL